MLHRVRIYNPTPVAAKCLAGAPGQLALGREDGTIEIWSTRYSLFCVNIFDTPYKCVEALAYAESPHEKKQLTLYSTGIDGRIVRYNSRGGTEETLLISGSPVWCLEASPSRRKLAAGTEDGFVHIIETNQDILVTSRRLQQKLVGRVLSCCWFSCETRLATGSQDSLKVWDLEKERAIETMQLSRVFKKEQALVFSVVVIEDGRTVVSGDSFGRVIFWDAGTGSQIQSMKLHAADVLILHATGNEVYASGVDPVIFKFFRGEGHWLHQKITQMHTHDIRAIWTEDDRLFTAGVDAQLGVVHLNSQNLHFQRILPPSYSRNIQTHENLILLNYGASVELWTTLPKDKIKMLVNLKAPKSSPFRYSTLCRSSFAVANDRKLMIYKFSLSKDNQLESVEKVYTTELPETCPLQSILLSPSGRRLFCAFQDGRLQMVNVAEETIETKAMLPATPITCSAVGSHLVAFGDVQGNVSLYDHDLKFKCTTPSSSATPVSLRFENDRLYVANNDLTFFEFCTKSEKYALWSDNCLKASAFEEKLAQIRKSMLSADGINDIVITPTNDVLLGFEAKVFHVKKSLVPADLKQGMIASPDFLNAVKLWRHHDDVAVCEISGSQLVSQLPPILKKKRFV
ncbi:U3 small nucleolar RNA-associated protein 4 homolog [Galendromus occidentalis]|uniref:U3 small nucleolar RNA-associated protein 4 homolog n=1 Tax=Galendromus occidentalis TaxID=34638 RepID=A0AAJ6W008_9ACAR|nr:U3 small nucleolar RNA-associated protein 4 homolog [Galendromus occidentalis]